MGCSESHGFMGAALSEGLLNETEQNRSCLSFSPPSYMLLGDGLLKPCCPLEEETGDGCWGRV